MFEKRKIKSQSQLCMVTYNYQSIGCLGGNGNCTYRFKQYPPTWNDINHLAKQLEEKLNQESVLITGWYPISEEGINE